MNLYDILLARCICSNKEDESITVTPLEVTENGEYEAAEGYAYNPVTVNVSSDFTTVKATVKNNSASIFTVCIPNLYDGGYGVFLNPTASVAPNEEKVFDAILYKNAGSGYIDTLAFDGTITVSGNAVYDSGYVDYTGDFTITYSER